VITDGTARDAGGAPKWFTGELFSVYSKLSRSSKYFSKNVSIKPILYQFICVKPLKLKRNILKIEFLKSFVLKMRNMGYGIHHTSIHVQDTSIYTYSRYINTCSYCSPSSDLYHNLSPTINTHTSVSLTKPCICPRIFRESNSPDVFIAN